MQGRYLPISFRTSGLTFAAFRTITCGAKTLTTLRTAAAQHWCSNFMPSTTPTNSKVMAIIAGVSLPAKVLARAALTLKAWRAPF